jgi:hypothetical protein
MSLVDNNVTEKLLMKGKHGVYEYTAQELA